MTESAEIRVGFDWQPGEHAEVVQILTRAQYRTVPVRLLKGVMYLVVAGWALLSLAGFLLDGDLIPFTSGLPWVLFIAFWYWIFTRGLGAASARSSTSLNADVHYPFTHRFDDTGLRIDGFGSSVELRWDGMVRATEEDGFFLFYWNAKCAYFTPKRVMSLEDQNRLRTLADRKLGADAKMRPLLTRPERSDG